MSPAKPSRAIQCDRKRHELFQHIADCVSKGLQTHGVQTEAAESVGLEVADSVADAFGGQSFSFPRDMARRLREREEQALAAFTGTNYAELAQRFQMTERGLRMLLQRALAKRSTR